MYVNSQFRQLKAQITFKYLYMVALHVYMGAACVALFFCNHWITISDFSVRALAPPSRGRPPRTGAGPRAKAGLHDPSVYSCYM